MNKMRLTDGQWAVIQPLLPPRATTGRPRADDRKTLEGILFVLRSGCRWQDVPRRYGAPTTIWRRLKAWQEDGNWQRLWRTVLGRLDAQGRLDWRYAFLDGSFAPAKKGGEGVGLTRKGKGTKWMLVVDGRVSRSAYTSIVLRRRRSPWRRGPSTRAVSRGPAGGHGSDRNAW